MPHSTQLFTTSSPQTKIYIADLDAQLHEEHFDINYCQKEALECDEKSQKLQDFHEKKIGVVGCTNCTFFLR